MSVITFELKEEHIKLLKHLRWSLKENVIVGLGHDGEEHVPVFGENNIYEAIDIILNGVPENFDPFNSNDEPNYTEDQKKEWDKLYSELPTALDVILFNGSFELGTYKTRWHDRVWKKTK